MKQAFEQALRVLPPKLQKRYLEALSEIQRERCEELRLRAGGRPAFLLQNGDCRFLAGEPVTAEDLQQVLAIASGYSVHTYQKQIASGFLPLEGGHRLGVCGEAVMEQGEILSFTALSSLNLRIAHQIKGIGAELAGRLFQNGRFLSTLIVSPPGYGKTTLLRDLVECLSDGEAGGPLRISLVDERGEIAASHGGTPQYTIGRSTDVLTGCSKAKGIELMTRSMGPQIIALDEITSLEDCRAISEASYCGCAFLATAHAAEAADLKRRPIYRRLLEDAVFQKIIVIRRTNGQRSYSVEDWGENI
ncbi:stage III sporulation protein AB [Acidaminobacterium chupaoyuni]